ncbi:hypothetical protein ABT364_12480 [Massilia sp. SR12]
MPQLIDHIDAIARSKQRAVLYLEFAAHAQRAQVLAWLDAHGMPWQECGPFCDGSGTQSYRGQVYIDVPYDENLAQYGTLRDYLEHADGSMRQEGVRFYAMPLDMAMRNAHHDEPGYWD